MSLFKRHRHQWGEATLTYTAPRQGMSKFRATEEDVFERMVHGFTTISQRCTSCGLVDTRIRLGKVEQ